MFSWWRHQMENIFRVAGPLCGEFNGHRWIPLAKASDAELCCFLWSAPERQCNGIVMRVSGNPSQRSKLCISTHLWYSDYKSSVQMRDTFTSFNCFNLTDLYILVQLSLVILQIDHSWIHFVKINNPFPVKFPFELFELYTVTESSCAWRQWTSKWNVKIKRNIWNIGQDMHAFL